MEEPGRAELYRDVYHKPVVYDEVKYEGNIPQALGTICRAEELVFRFWNATVAGTYVGHGETYQSPDEVLWWSKGGVLKGQSPARLAFLKKVLDDAPPEGIDPIDKWQDPRIGGKAGKYYLIYFGKERSTNWVFNLPRKNLADGSTFQVEILDTWNMTVSPVDGSFTAKKDGDYAFKDVNGRSVALPGKPWMALRIRKEQSLQPWKARPASP